MSARYRSIGEPVQQVFRQFGEIGDVDRAVAAMALVKLFCLEMPAKCGFYDFSAEPVFNVVLRFTRGQLNSVL